MYRAGVCFAAAGPAGVPGRPPPATTYGDLKYSSVPRLSGLAPADARRDLIKFVTLFVRAPPTPPTPPSPHPLSFGPKLAVFTSARPPARAPGAPKTTRDLPRPAGSGSAGETERFRRTPRYPLARPPPLSPVYYVRLFPGQL